MQFHDALTLDASSTARICADGSLVAEVLAARTGLQAYLGSEVDPSNAHGLRDRATVQVYRPASEVFNRDSLASFSAAPVTVDHPTVAVDAANWRELGVGEIHGDVVRDGERVRVPIIVRDASAVKAATTTHKQLSMGYATELVFPTDGKHPDGTACDAYQTNLRINHIALVRAARGGPELRVVDERPGHTLPNGDLPMKTLTIDGLRVPNVSDEAEAAINKLQADNAKIATDLTAALDASTTAATTIQTKDAEIATLKQQLADAVITPAMLRDAAKAYAVVCDKAKAMGVQFAEDADADTIKAAVVTAKLGDLAKGWTADQIAISFDTLSANVKPAAPTVQPIGAPKVMGDSATAVQSARAQWLADKQNAHRNSAAA
ncbi:DUF2213 domain-containing protein [Croceibacterium ferulae]|uniref:DUF2213 domain-containing protein n=1 Tax=Croceibacterium ferulae TaxID=1854641 RepID=UPI001F4EB729|nr:DUF2213 domain-containing protein [Croceibacterium ferulae]